MDENIDLKQAKIASLNQETVSIFEIISPKKMVFIYIYNI